MAFCVRVIVLVGVILLCCHLVTACTVVVGIYQLDHYDNLLISTREAFHAKAQQTRIGFDMSFKSFQVNSTANSYEEMFRLRGEFIVSGVTVVIGPYNSYLDGAASHLNIPYIVTDSVPIQAEGYDNTIVALLPSQKHMVHMAYDVSHKYHWSNIAILYEHPIGVPFIEKFVQYTTMRVYTWKMRGSISRQELKRDLMELRTETVRHILVACSVNLTERIFQEALKLSMLSENFQWLIPSVDPHHIDTRPFEYTGVNFTIGQITDEKDYQAKYNATYMLKAAAQDAVTIVTHATSNSLIRSDTCPRRGKAFYRELIAFRGVGSLGRYEFDKDGLRTDYTVTLDGLTDKGLKKIGSWKRVKQNSIDLHRAMLQSGPNIPSNSYPLGKETVRAVTIIEPPFVDFVPGYENLTGNARFQGYSIDLLNEIAKLLNFKYELYLVEDGQFGIKTASGEWNGIVGELLKGNASLAGAPLTINVQREEVIDFSKPFKTIGISILIKRPQDNVSYFQFMLPLSVNVWMLIIIALAFVSVIMVVIDTIYPATDGSVRFNIKESLWFNYGALVQAGTENLPRTISGRMLASTWWFFSLIIISSYTANLAAFLTVSKFNTPISSVADLAAQTEVKYGTVWNSQVMSFFENSKIEHFKRMWAYMSTTNPQSMAMTSQEAFEKVANSSGDYAFLWDSPVVKYKTTQDCRMIEVGHAFDSKGYGIGVPPGAPYRDSLTMAILHLNEKGVLQRLDEKWWRDTKCADENNKSATTQHTALSLNMVAGVFFFLLGGTALSVAVGVMEWLMNRRRKRNDPKNEMKRMSSTTNHEEPVLLRDPFTAIKNHATLNDNKNVHI